MENTLEEIGERMQPRHLLDDVLDFFRSRSGGGEKWKDATGRAARSAGAVASRLGHGVVETVRQHPIPTLLIGAGIVWACYEHSHGTKRRFSNGNSSDSNETEEQAGWSEGSVAAGAQSVEGNKSKHKLRSKIAATGEQLKETGQRAGQRVSESARFVGQKASQMAERVAKGAKRGYEAGRARFVEASDAYPLAVGVGFLAAGVLMGLSLPHTHPEDRLAGEASDRLKSRARAKGKDLVERGQRVVSAAAQAAKETAEKEGLAPTGSS
jgi:hypothetical protein